MTTYSIHLDDLDVALLPIGRCSNNFLRKELFEFQLLAKEAEDPPVYTNHSCHICAIDVPAAFWSAHCVGVKHRANARIATAAAQRMGALITTNPPPHNPHLNEKFCDSCTCIAGKDHEKTQEHKLSVFQDKMLCDLVMIYIGEDINNENEKKENTKDFKDTTCQEYIEKADEDIAKADLGVVYLNGDQSPIVENDTDIPNQKKIENIDSKICNAKRVTRRYTESFVINNEEVKVNVKKDTNTITTAHIHVNHQDTASTLLEDHKLSVIQDTNLCDLETINTSDDVNNDQKKKKKNKKKKKKKKKGSKDAREEEQKVIDDIQIEDLNKVELTAVQTPKVKNGTNIQNQNKMHHISGDNSEAVPIMPSYAEVMSNKKENNKTNNTATKVNPQDVSEQNNGLDAKDYPLLDENEIHYPFVKELTEVRCLVCDCITPSDLQNRVLHVMGRRHVTKVGSDV